MRNSLRVYVDDVDITNDIYEPLPREDILGPGNLVTGFIYYKAIPLSYFENENIGVVRLFARDIHRPIDVTRSITRSFNIDWFTNNTNTKTVPMQSNIDVSNNLKGIDIHD
ncbi:hypothetical protein [Amphibacillus jilinensis]|uniref:hypothetical protein n=1 Tax=Amphibacillus jilinensis TaxID=1216008 RepID=UPI0011818629|nr:hypothetical protein [Amphibacillus jilinensis]